MRIPDKYRSLLAFPPSISLQDVYKRVNNTDTPYSSDLFKRTLKCAAGEEVPVFFPDSFKHGIELYIPLLYNTIIPSVSLATNVFRILKGSCVDAANRVSIGSKYYLGYAGFIMEEEGDILFIITYKGRDFKLYIHPKVAIDTKDPLCKFIMQTLLPFYLSIKYAGVGKLPVEIKDVTSIFIDTPELPVQGVDINEDVHKFLSDNFDTLMEVMNDQYD